MVEVELTLISSALSAMWPPLSLRLDASRMPDWLMTLRVTASAPAADNSMAPPSARMAWRLSISVLSVSAPTLRPISRLPEKLRVTRSPAPNATVPCGALIVPELVMVGAMKAR